MDAAPAASPDNKPQRGYALFDLDHTLLPYDTQVLFLNYVLRREGWRRLYLLLFLPLAPLAAIRIMSLRTMKRIFTSYLWGMPLAKLREHARQFVATDFSRALYPEVVAELNRHRAEGRRLILNTASPALYAGEIAEALGFDDWVATPLVMSDPMPLFPQISGPNNKYEVKVAAMLQAGLLPPGYDPEKALPLPDSWGYSDSSADIPMLSLCSQVRMVHPTAPLALHGAGRDGWETLTPARPYAGRAGDIWAVVRQLFGLYRPKTTRD